MEARYKCIKSGCFHPRCDRMMKLMDRIECDPDGNPLYTAYCEFHGDVFGGIREAELIYPKENESEPKLSPIVDDIVGKVVEQIPKIDVCKSNDKAIAKLVQEVKLLRRELGYGNSSPHRRSSENEKCVALAVDYYWYYINNKTPRHNAISMACNRVEREIGLGSFKSARSFWSAVNDELKIHRGKRLGIEYPVLVEN